MDRPSHRPKAFDGLSLCLRIVLGAFLVAATAMAEQAAPATVPAAVPAAPKPAAAPAADPRERLQQVNLQIEAVDAEQAKLREEFKGVVEAIKQLSQGTQGDDKDLAAMAQRIADLQKELKDLQEKVQARVVAMPAYQDCQAKMKALTAKMKELADKQKPLIAERISIARELKAAQGAAAGAAAAGAAKPQADGGSSPTK